MQGSEKGKWVERVERVNRPDLERWREGFERWRN